MQKEFLFQEKAKWGFCIVTRETHKFSFNPFRSPVTLEVHLCIREFFQYFIKCILQPTTTLFHVTIAIFWWRSERKMHVMTVFCCRILQNFPSINFHFWALFFETAYFSPPSPCYWVWITWRDTLNIMLGAINLCVIREGCCFVWFKLELKIKTSFLSLRKCLKDVVWIKSLRLVNNLKFAKKLETCKQARSLYITWDL